MKHLSTKEWIAVTVSIVVVVIFFTGLVYVLFPMTQNTSDQSGLDAAALNNTLNTATDTSATGGVSANVPPAELPTPTAGQILIHDTVVGTGATAAAGDKVTVDYVGMFQDGKKFDSSIDRGTPFEFSLGAGQVIQGWDKGVVGMKVGGSRILVIPPDLGYGSSTYGPIPGNSVLVFQVKLISIANK